MSENKGHLGFKHIALNLAGQTKIAEVEHFFNKLLVALKSTCPPGREFALTITKLEEASFFAKKSVSLAEENQAKITDGVTEDHCPRCNVPRSTGCIHYVPLKLEVNESTQSP